MAPNRSNDGTAGYHYRSDRCIDRNGFWYVATREGIEVGPFETKIDAESAAPKISQLLADADDPKVALSFLRDFLRRARV